MKFKNVDILFSRKLASFIPTNEILFEDRLNSEEGVSLQIEQLPIIIKAFINQNEIFNYDKLPEQLTTYIQTFMKKDNKDIMFSDLQDLFSLCDFMGYPLKLIQRLDLPEIAEIPETTQRAYLYSNALYNNSMTCGVFSGYAMNYDALGVPVATDFIERFRITQEMKELFDLETSLKTYDLFRNMGKLKDYNDSQFLKYFVSRGFRYCIERDTL